MGHKPQSLWFDGLSLVTYGKPDLHYRALSFACSVISALEMAAEAKYAAGKKTNQLFRWDS